MRKNPKPPRTWHLPKRKGGTGPAGPGSGSDEQESESSTVGQRPQRLGKSKAASTPTKDPIVEWLEKKLHLIMPKIPAWDRKGFLTMDDWTGEKVGEGSFGLVFKLRDGRIFKLGFDYSEAWFINNLNTFFPDFDDEALNALPRIDYFQDISRFSGWQYFILQGAVYAEPVFKGAHRDAAAFVVVREDVSSLSSSSPIEKAVSAALNMFATRTRTSVESREAPDDPTAPSAVPNLRRGLFGLEDFEINGRPSQVGLPETTAGHDAVEAARIVLGPAVRLIRSLVNKWEIYLPDARAANFGLTADGKLVLRDLGWVYAPQYHEWNVSGPRMLEEADDE